MNSRLGRTIVIVVGAIAVIVGLLWIGQGSGLIPGSVMSGDTKWLSIGIVVGVIGAVLVVFGVRRPRRQ